MEISPTPVSFPNSNGHRLFGIFHQPSAERFRKECIIILSPGIKSRVAPHRLYVKMARSFVDLGFPVLRFDFYGLGDSEGELEEKYAADFYGSVQVGRYVNDTICAMDWLEQEHKMSKFILSGLCGGAITGLLTAAQDNRVSGLHSLSIPVILDSSDIIYDEFLTPAELRRRRSSYIGKLLSMSAWKSWVRFFTFQSDYRLIFRSLLQSSPPKKEKDGELGRKMKKNDIKNPLFPTAFEKTVSSGKEILFIFAEADRLYWQFKENFIKKNNVSVYNQDNFNVYVVKHANHIFSFKKWNNEVIDKSLEWLENKY